MQELLDLAAEYCQKKNLIYADYVAAMTAGDLDNTVVKKLIEYHKEWLR